MSALHYDCLGLPETSDAFSAHPKILSVPKNKGIEKASSIHPHKAPRLTRDADSASASRSRVATPLAGRNTGGAAQEDCDAVMMDVEDEDSVLSVVLKIDGAPCTFL